MDSNYLIQRRINAQKKFRRKVTLTIALSAVLLVLILIGLVKVIADEKKASDGSQENNSQTAGQLTPGAITGTPDGSGADDNTGSGETSGPQNETGENGSGETAGGTEPTQTPAETATPTPIPVPAKKVAVDAGHGGSVDYGSSRPGENLYEKNANLAIALYLQEELVSRGYEVYMIRETDEAVENRDRPDLALENGADIYVSIHLNSLEEDSDATRGAEVWYSDLRNDDSDVLAQYVVDELTKVIDTRNRGIKLSNNLIVLKYNTLPACLVECGFMSSETERAKLFDPEYQKQIAKGIANGIEKFLPLE